jgi:hypothetical protein
MVNPMNYPPSYNDLMDKALNYLKESHPEDYNGMSIQRRNKYAESAAKRAEGFERKQDAQSFINELVVKLKIQKEHITVKARKYTR